MAKNNAAIDMLVHTFYSPICFSLLICSRNGMGRLCVLKVFFELLLPMERLLHRNEEPAAAQTGLQSPAGPSPTPASCQSSIF